MSGKVLLLLLGLVYLCRSHYVAFRSASTQPMNWNVGHEQVFVFLALAVVIRFLLLV